MICEGCIKQDTCKYREVVEEYEADAPKMSFDEPLEAIVQCKYREIYIPPCCDTTTDNWNTTTDLRAGTYTS